MKDHRSAHSWRGKPDRFERLRFVVTIPTGTLGSASDLVGLVSGALKFVTRFFESDMFKASTPLSRRTLLHAGGLWAVGLFAAAVVRREGSRRKGCSGSQTGPRIGSAKACILLYMLGGPPQQETFDLKPERARQPPGACSSRSPRTCRGSRFANCFLIWHGRPIGSPSCDRCITAATRCFTAPASITASPAGRIFPARENRFSTDGTIRRSGP